MSEKNLLNSIIPEEYREKMNIDEDGKMHLTPSMAEALGLVVDEEGGEVVKGEGFEKAKLSSLEKRTITEEEYNILPRASRRGAHHLFNLGYFFTVVVLIAMCALIYINPGLTEYGVKGKALTVAAFLLLIVIITACTMRKGMPREAEIVAGKVIFMKATRNNRKHLHYLLTVAIPEKKKIVEQVECSRETYGLVGADSKVFIYKGNAYAAQRPSKAER